MMMMIRSTGFKTGSVTGETTVVRNPVQDAFIKKGIQRSVKGNPIVFGKIVFQIFKRKCMWCMDKFFQNIHSAVCNPEGVIPNDPF